MVPIMNPYPGSNSVIVMDNARIHHDANLISILKGLRYCVIFLPPYSPDYNPIETAFSVIKSWIKCNCDFMEACNDLIYSLLVACGQITPQMYKWVTGKSWIAGMPVISFMVIRVTILKIYPTL
ncbi:hypothetical protein RclHR1_07980008 [Rhizophagus clarus]|uniref:Tc1-like transposase DDE domain-containing protein n=1 Tax=Rhizophagus clarus TaxID=94130 RepID=A0A2Z6RZ67_9GLOM|nr:hypothetical protein RclHR1_07980008 [Rhizophagus clarus]